MPYISAEDFAYQSTRPGTPEFIMMQNLQMTRIINHEISVDNIFKQIIEQQREENQFRINLATTDALRIKLETDLIRAEEVYIAKQVEQIQKQIEASRQNDPTANIVTNIDKIISSLTEQKEQVEKELAVYEEKIQKHRGACNAVNKVVDDAYNDVNVQREMRRIYEEDARARGITDPARIQEGFDAANERGRNAHINLEGVQRLLQGRPVHLHTYLLATALKKNLAVNPNPEMKVNITAPFIDQLYEVRNEVATSLVNTEETYKEVNERKDDYQALVIKSAAIDAIINRLVKIRPDYDAQDNKNSKDWE